MLELICGQKPEIPVVVGGSVVMPVDSRAIEAEGLATGFGPVAERSEFVEAIIRQAGRR